MTQEDLCKKRPIIEIFNSIEGESATMGEPTIFVRLTGCNLRCVFANSVCDTAYSSFKPEKGKYCYQDVIDMMNKYPMTPSISITGAEPFLNSDVVSELINICDGVYDKFIIVETNGSIVIDRNLLQRIDLLNISPKLSSSEPTQEKCDKLGIKMTEAMKSHAEKRYNKEALWNMIQYARDFRLKYVVGDKSDFEEIEQQIRELMDYDISKRRVGSNTYQERSPIVDEKGQELWYDTLFIKPWNITLMPAGECNEQLNQNRRMVAEYCAEHGYNYTDRLQILIWGTEKER